jgi:ribonucleoside-triphosphate reductase
LYESKSGERGVFSREACKKMSPERRDTDHEFGTNPCAEIILRSKQFCNLSEVVIRYGDTLEQLKRKVRLATILGTLQATLTDFRYLSASWKKNTVEERLLGVSLTGMMDHATLSTTNSHMKSWLRQMKEIAIETNESLAEELGIPMAAAITCVKPSGTVSQLTNSASGIHPRYSKYYIRTVRHDMKDPLSDWMIERGFPAEPGLTFDGSDPTNWVFSFPVKGPSDSVYRNDMKAMDQLKHWKVVAENWCEHKPSITVYVREPEWLEVGAWVYKNFDILSGISFLPYDGGNYRQAPYQEIDEDAFKEAVKGIPKDVLFSDYRETEDHTEGSQLLACVGGSCEI